MQTNPIYRVCLREQFENYPEAQAMAKHLEKIIEDLEVTYYIPQPKYKSWVPNWLIRFITK